MSPAAPPQPPEEDVVGRAYDGRLVRRLLPHLLPQAPLMALAFVWLLLVDGAQLAQPWLMKRMIDEHLLRGDVAGLARLALLYLATLGLEGVARYQQNYTMERTGQNVILTLRRKVFARLQDLDSSFFDRHPVGRLMTRVTTDVESLADLFASGAVTLLGDLLKLVAIVGILWWLDWRLALVTFTITPIFFVLSVVFRGRIRSSYRDLRRRLARINAFLQEAITGMLLVQLFGRQGEDRREFRDINRDHLEAEKRSVVYESTFSSIVEMVGSLARAAIICYGGARAARAGLLPGDLSPGTLFAFLEYTGRFFGPLTDLSGFYAVLQAAMASLERIFDLLDTEPRVRTAPGAVEPAAPPLGLVEFDAVRFAYRDGMEVLRDVSFRVEPGSTVALVGATGAGKTSIIKLLMRLYDPTAGAIRLDGRDLRVLPLPYVRRHVGVVMQDHFLVTGTVAENIAFGDRSLRPEQIERAAGLVHADRFIAAFPSGYGEPIRERGGNLSVGQKQLLSLARAVASDPALLILDEATSSVDTETEILIQDALRRVLRGRTSIVIAHRLSTILSADRILVLHHGRLVEEGRHRELLEARGLYFRLYELQFARAARDLDPGAPRARPDGAPPLPSQA